MGQGGSHQPGAWADRASGVDLKLSVGWSILYMLTQPIGSRMYIAVMIGGTAALLEF